MLRNLLRLTLKTIIDFYEKCFLVARWRQMAVFGAFMCLILGTPIFELLYLLFICGYWKMIFIFKKPASSSFW